MTFILVSLIALGLLWLLANNQAVKKKQALATIAENEQADINQLQELHTQYRTALASTDRQLALTTGRAYYTFMRNGPITPQDEQIIHRELGRL